MPNELLVKLLGQSLPRGMRCASCTQWRRDESDQQIGYCAEHEFDTMHIEGCVYWQPTAACGLDYMGVPLASPLAANDA